MNTPIFQAVTAYIKKDIFPFHTPGHKGMWPLHELATANDLGRADFADDIGTFPEVFQESQESAARTYYTKKTLYMVNGSTAGVHAAFLATVKPGEKIIVGRNLHVSVANALIMTGAVPVYVQPVKDYEGFLLNVTPESVIAAIEKNPDAKAVFLTTPSYTGICLDVLSIAEVTHEHGMVLIVDEAWGAHLPFGEEFPPSALFRGADIVIHGAHKTLPSLTGTALLHANTYRISPERLENCLHMVETTSPNTLLYMSLEQAIHTMYHEGKDVLNNARASVQRATNRILQDTVFGCGFPDEINPYAGSFSIDPIKLLIRTNYRETGITGQEVSRFICENHGIVAEMADLESALFVFTGFEEEAGDGFLVYGLRHASQELEKTQSEHDQENSPEMIPDDSEKIKKLPGVANISLPETVMTPREAFFSPDEDIPLADSVGRILRTGVVPYPPGIPITMPGERITPAVIEYLRTLLEAGGDVKGMTYYDKVPCVNVVK